MNAKILLVFLLVLFIPFSYADNWLKADASSCYPINISVGATQSDINTTFILNANITDFGLTVSDDINRLLVFDQDKDAEIDRVIDLDRVTGV